MTAHYLEPIRPRPPAAASVPSGNPRPRVGRVIALILMLPLVFSVGRHVPGFGWTIELGIAVSLILTAISMFGSRPRQPDRFTIYLMLVAFVLPILSALGAYIAFQQPPWFGWAAQRGCLFALFAYAAGNLLADGKITISEFRRALVILAWVNLTICSLVVALFDPNDYNDLPGLVTDGGGLYNRFILPVVFIVFGAFYYFSRLIKSGKAVDGLLSAPFLLYIVAAYGGRSAMLAMLIALVVLTWLGSPSRRFSNALAATMIAGATLLVIEAAFPGTMDRLYVSFGDAFAAVMGADNVSDVSANARILQAEIALPYVMDNIILGTGTISNQWFGGYEAMFGYFHPADLGLLGLLFTYGVAGLLFFSVQYIIFARMIPPLSILIRRAPNDGFILCLVALLTYFLASALATGLFILNPEQTLLIFVLLRSEIRRYSLARQ